MFFRALSPRLKGGHYRHRPLAAWVTVVAIALVTGLLTALPMLQNEPAFAAAAHVQSIGSWATTGATTTTAAFSGANTAGNTIVASATWTTDGSLRCSDSQGNSYTTITTQTNTGANKDLAICYATNIAGGAGNTVTATYVDSQTNRGLIISEYSGISASNPVDVVATVAAGSGSTAANNVTSSAAVTTSKGSLIYGAVMNVAGASVINPGTGFTERTSVGSEQLQIEDLTQATAGSVAATWTFGLSGNYISAMVAFRAAGENPAEPATSDLGDGLMIYGSLNTSPRWRTYDAEASTFATATRMNTGGYAYSSTLRTSPTKQEAVAAYADDWGYLTVACFDGSSWRTEWMFYMGGTQKTRRYDIAYETASGDVIVMYSTDASTNNEMAYRTKPGTSGCGSSNWSAATNLSSARTNGAVEWVRLAADRRADSNLITAIWVDSVSDLSAMQWSGTTWGNEPASALDTSVEFATAAQDSQTLDVEYESAGDAMVVWANSAGADGTNGVRYATCTGGTASCTWSAATTPPTFADDATNLDLSANPISDEMVFASIGNAGSDLQIGYWSGSAWTNTANVDTGAQVPLASTQLVSTGWLVVGAVARSVIVYNQSATTNVGWYVGNGSTFTLQTDYTTSPALGNPQSWYDIQVDPIRRDRLMLSVSDGSSDLFAKRLVMDGLGAFTWSAADGGAALETSLMQSITGPFAFAFWRNVSLPALTQNGFVWENDDEDLASGDAVDENTQQAAGNTAVTDVAKGERVTARVQLTNTGGPLTGRVGLFYDRNDGIWSKVGAPGVVANSGGSDCSNTTFDCIGVDTTGDVGRFTSTVVDNKGSPWVSYYDSTNGDLRVARYVGSEGTGCATSAWTCTTIDSTGNVGQYTSIAMDPGGAPWVSYYDVTNGDLKLARYVSSGGSGCASGAWNCSTIDSTGDTGQYTSIAFDAAGRAWISHYKVTNQDLRIARFVVAGGTGCASSSWTCESVETTNVVGLSNSLAFDSTGNAWISHRDITNGVLRVARYVTAGGTGCAIASWSCVAVDNGNVGTYSSIEIDPSGMPWISHRDGGVGRLKVARYVGSGGTGCLVSTWTCMAVESGDFGHFSSLAFAPDGHAWVSHMTGTGTLRLTRYVGSGGSGCLDSAWTCTAVSTAGSNTEAFTSMAFDANGRALISHFGGSSDLRIAMVDRTGEIAIGDGFSGGKGDSLEESHADMASVADTTNRDDSDCLSGSTAWSNGAWFESEEASEVRFPSGLRTPQCTELSFVLDTSNALASTTYRFVLAVDNGPADRWMWRGASTISQYPTLTIQADTTKQLSKESTPKLTNCTNTAWGCAAVDSTGQTARSTTIDSAGNPWLLYDATAGMKIARYVGSGGTCVNSMFSCTLVDSSGSAGVLAAASGGSIWIAYDRGGALWIARYVATGGTGCAGGATDWTCSTLDPTGSDLISMTVDQRGNPIIAHADYAGTPDPVRLARYVGTGGAGCATGVTAWTCSAVDTVADVEASTSVAVAADGTIWLAYAGNPSSNFNIVVAQFVGANGSGCGSTTGWNCTTITNTNGALRADISIAPDGKPWLVWTDWNTGMVVSARYDGDAVASGCGGSAAWTCETVDTHGSDIIRHSIKFDAAGVANVAFYDSVDLRLVMARYTGTGGTGCTGTTAWSCQSPYAVSSKFGLGPTIAFDHSGTAWVFGKDDNASSTGVVLTKLHAPATPIGTSVNQAIESRDARGGGLRYRLDSGQSPRGQVGCSSTTDSQGYCGVSADDSAYDGVTALANHRPIYAMRAKAVGNSVAPSVTWKGRSSVSAATNNVTLQVYRYGTTNAWETTGSVVTGCTASDCTATSGMLAGPASEYFSLENSNYWTSIRVYQEANTGGNQTLKTNAFDVAFASPPDEPNNLQQKTTGDVVLATGAWHNTTSVKFTADVSDVDNPDSLQLCVEAQPIASSFTGTETLCGSSQATAGGSVSASVTLALSTDTEYHWQAVVKDSGGRYSSWESYGSNLESVRDVGIDNSAPTGGTVYDGTVVGVDVGYNTGSLSSMSANWSGVVATSSGLSKYEYSIGTSAGAANIRTWTNNATSTSVTATGLSLQTGQMYYVSIRTTDNAGNVSSEVHSNGQTVALTLSFSLDTQVPNFDVLGIGNGYSDTAAVVATVSTNSASGYRVEQYSPALMAYGTAAISMYSGTWADPTAWTGTGFGYTSSDTSVSGSNRFNGGTEYAGVRIGPVGDVIADSTGPTVAPEQHTITYRIAVDSAQAAGQYRASLVLSAVALF